MKRRTFLTTTAGAACGAVSAARAADPHPLAGHRIDAIGFRSVRLPWPRQVGKNARLDVHGRGPTVDACILRTGQGASGWGMIQGDRREVEALRERIAGRPVAELIDPASGIRAAEWRPLDLPLHDLAGVILGQPVWRMLGAEQPVITKVYSGMIYFDDLEPPEGPAGIAKVIEECRWDRDRGYRQLKLKVGRGHRWMKPEDGLARDIEVVRAVAREVPDCEILVDGNNGFTADTFIRFLEGIEGIPLFWIEEPFHETLADWRKLGRWTREHGRAKTWLADGEYDPDAEVLEQLQHDGVINLRLEDILGHGFTRWRKWLPELAAMGVSASPHAWGAGLKTVYIAHLAAGLGNVPTIEGITTLEDDVDYGDNRIRDGRFHPSHRPGFGLTLHD